MSALLGYPAFLEGKPWAKLHDSCIRCGTSEHKHKGHGLCTLCHWKNQYATNPAFAEQVKERARRGLFNRYDERATAIALWKKQDPARERRYKAKYRAKKRLETGVGHSARWTPGKAIALDDLRLYGSVASAAYRCDGEWVVDLRLESGSLLEGVPTGRVRRVA